MAKSSRPRHSNKEIEAAVQYAEGRGWTCTIAAGHAWGLIRCPFGARGGCQYSIWFQAIAELIKEERRILDEIEAYLIKRIREASEKTIPLTFQETPEQEWVDQWNSWGGNLLFIMKQLEKAEPEIEKSNEEVTLEMAKDFEGVIVEVSGENFSKGLLEQLIAVIKMKKKEDFSRTRKRLDEQISEHVRKKATESVRKKSVSLKKDFAGRSTEMAGKKLDLDAFERQYREAR